MSQVGAGGTATQGAVREAGSRQPVHVQGEPGSLDHQGTQVTEQGNPGQGRTDPEAEGGPRERPEEGGDTRSTDQRECNVS